MIEFLRVLVASSLRSGVGTLSENEQTLNKKKRKKSIAPATVIEQEKGQKEQVPEEKQIQDLMTLLDDLRKKGKIVDIQICPRCKSPRIRRVGSMSGDMSGQMALTSPKYECLDCGWRGRLTLYATNRPIDKKMMAVVADALEIEEEDLR